MNKISKKIVALATMAAFVLTLVPAAAFGASNDSSVQVADKSAVVEVDQETGVATAEVALNIGTKDAGDFNFVVWLEDENGDVYRYAEPVTNDEVTSNPTGWPGAALILDQTPAAGKTFNVQFKIAKVGTYTVHAAVDTTKAIPDYETLIQPGNIIPTAGAGTIEVQDNTVIKALDLTADDGTDVTYDKGVFDLNLLNSNFVANGSDSFTLTGTAYLDSDKTMKAVNKVVTLISEKPDVLKITTTDIDADTDGVQVKTDKNGQFKLTFKMNDNRNVPITIIAGENEYTVKVTKETTRAYDIDTVEDGGYVLAGDATEWTKWAAVDSGDKTATLSDAVTFSVTDIKGDVVNKEDMTGEPAMTGYTGTTPAHSQYVDIVTKPDDSELSADDLYLTEVSDGVYSLVYSYYDQAGSAAMKAKRAADLVPGKYVVTVSLLSGDYAEATFYVADFGKVQDTVIEMEAHDMSTQLPGGEPRKVDITDEVTLGQVVTAQAYYVDGNGIKISTDDVTIGAYGNALVDNKTGNGTVVFTTKADIAANESLLGTTITVTGFNADKEQWIEKELTVVDSYNAFSLEFDPTEGPVSEDNDVTVSVVKEDGSTAQVTGTIIGAYVADQSNKDAKVTVDVTKASVSKGKGEISVYASQPTTAEIVVAVQDSTNDGLYAATLDYTFGNVDITAHHNVVMTIGSSEYVVDKQLFTMDAAPYVDSNWRTMVPIRALAEAFDATVTYDNDDRTVTIEYNDQTIVMTIDEATYTVNGVEGEMDTEAVIKGDRTYVPIRFAAEAMGFTVTALYDENSSTASVVFQS